MNLKLKPEVDLQLEVIKVAILGLENKLKSLEGDYI